MAEEKKRKYPCAWIKWSIENTREEVQKQLKVFPPESFSSTEELESEEEKKKKTTSERK